MLVLDCQLIVVLSIRDTAYLSCALVPCPSLPCRLAARTPGSSSASDPVASGLLPMLMPMMASAYNTSGRTEEVSQGMHAIMTASLFFFNIRFVLCAIVIYRATNVVLGTQ